jgi:hypothetical protein
MCNGHALARLNEMKQKIRTGSTGLREGTFDIFMRKIKL